MLKGFGYLALIVTVLCLYFNWNTHQEPTLHYRAEFQPSMIEGVEILVKKIAVDKRFDIYEENRSAMAQISGSLPAFFIRYEKNEQTIMVISSAGLVDVLTIYIFEQSNFSELQVKQLSELLITSLENEFGLEFELI